MSEEKKNKNVWTSIVCSVCGIGVGALIMFLCQKCSPIEPVEPIIIHDSITVQDSDWIAEHTKPKYVVRHDTMWLPKPSDEKGDTIYVDSIPVEIPIMAYEYRDTFATDTSSIELAVAFSGYNAKIDSIGLNYTFVVEPKIVDKKKGWRWAVMPSINVGYGVGMNGNQVIATPYVGVGVSVGFGYTWRK